MTAPPSRLDDKAMVALVERLNSEGLLCAAADAISALQKELDTAHAVHDDLVECGSLDELRELSDECERRDICSRQPFEMSYCRTRRFAEQVEKMQSALAASQAALRKYGGHADNCNIHDDGTSLCGFCTCGLTAALSTEAGTDA